MKSAAATWSRGLYRPIRAFWSWGSHIPLLLPRSIWSTLHVHDFALRKKSRFIFTILFHSGYFYSASSSPLLLLEALPKKHGYCVGVSRQSATTLGAIIVNSRFPSTDHLCLTTEL